MNIGNTRTSIFGRVSLRLVIATVFLSFALFVAGVALFVTQTTGAQSGLPTISFHEITSVREGETAMIMVSVSEPLSTPLPLTLNLVQEGSTATRNEDYTLTPGGVRIERGETMAVIQVPTLAGGDNYLYEGDETVVLELRVNENRVQFNTPDVRTLTIEDMLPVPTLKVHFEGPAHEGVDKDFTVSLSHAADVPVTVSVAALSSSKAETTTDHKIKPSTFAIAARELTATFTLETVQDGVYEFTETVILKPQASIAAMALKSAPDGDATVVIAESDPIPTVSVSDDVEIDEDTGVAEFTVNLSGALDTTVTLSLGVNDRSTADSDDYNPLPATFEIAPRATAFTFTLEITPDEVYELSETLELDLSFMALALNLGMFARVVTIRNDDRVVAVDLGVIGPTDIAEGETVTIGIELDRPLTQFLADNLAIDTSYEENVFAGSNFEDISSATDVREFSIVSNSEAYTQTLGFGFQFYTEIYDTIAVHTNGLIGFTDDPDDLLDNTDNPDGYRGDDTPAIEGEIVPIVAPLLSSINYRNPDGLNPAPAFYGARLGAGTADDRYIVQYTNARVRVAAGVRALATFQVALYANGRIELRYQDIPSEVQKVAKIGISNGEGTNMYEEFSYRESRLSESDTRIVYTPSSRVNAVIKDADGETVTNFGILDIIAVDEVSGTIQLVNRNREDTNWDGDQVYTVELVSASPLVVLTGTVATYTFTDDELPEVVLEYVCTAVCARAEIAEGASLTLIVKLTNAPAGAAETVTVNLETGGSATENLDYILPTSITIAEGTTQAIFIFSPTKDNLAERTEDVTIGFRSIEYGDNEIQSDVRQELFITDNDPRPPISLDEVVPIIEGVTRVVTARLEAALGFPLDVTLIATDISARASENDYAIATATLTIPAGSLTADFEVMALADQLSEEVETFELNLQVPPETVGLDVDATRVVTILDGVVLVNLSSSGNAVLEGQEFEIRLDPGGSSDYDLTIDIANSTAGFDFAQDITSVKFARDDGVLGPQETVTAFPQTFQVMSGTRSIILTFEVTNDREIEADESFTLEVTSSADYVVIDPNSVEVTLSDYIVGVDVSVIGPTDIAEGEMVTIGIELDRPLTQFLADSLSAGVLVGSNFEEISSTVGVRRFPTFPNNAAYLQALGFGFNFYGETYNNIAVHTNGFIGFTDDANDLRIPGVNVFSDRFKGDETPASGDEITLPIVAPLLAAIDPRHHADIAANDLPNFYGVRLGADTSEDRYIVQYTNAHVAIAPGGSRVAATFQVALYANGRIEFRYQDIPSEVQEAAKIGISNGDDTNMYEEFSYRESKLSEADTRIVYTPPSVDIVIKDADGETVTSDDILDLIAVDGVRGTIQLVNRSREDTYWLGDESYTAELVSASPLIVPTGTVAMYRFTDDDLPEVALEYDMCTTVCARAELAEGDSLPLVVRLTNVAPTGAPEAVTVNLVALDGTATETLDYTLPTSITIAEGTSQAIFTFSPTDDNLAERTEVLVIGISSVEYGGNQIPSSASFELSITDDDPRPTISLDPVAPITEGATRVVTARLHECRAGLPAGGYPGSYGHQREFPNRL